MVFKCVAFRMKCGHHLQPRLGSEAGPQGTLGGGLKSGLARNDFSLLVAAELSSAAFARAHTYK